ncbi:TPR-like protein [Ascodesmis nigricans]|uniref:protein O-GlcNAc transferase n=1 Tax=Ascodesmis nigricans TaxID=341454 RepID=A0A4S2MTS1_9PEZI|nr:TPR-like protein [Ascodesmis nigricans]
MFSRESVAIWAHKTYIELLASIHGQHRSDAKSSGNASSPLKPHLFPRPPRTQRSPVSSLNSQTKSRSNTGYFFGTNTGGYQSPIGVSSPVQNLSHTSGYPFSMVDGTGMGMQGQKPLQVPTDSYIASAIPRHMNGLTSSLSLISPVSASPSPLSSPAVKQLEAISQARAALGTLEKLCAESGWTWIDGLLFGGCLAYGLGDLNSAISWFRRVLVVEERHVEALSNLALTFLSQNRREEAEQYWRLVVKTRPSHFEAVEHLIGLLVGDHRGKDVVETINFVENSLRRPHDASQISNTDTAFASSNRSPFNIPGSDIGRMVALIHAKGNMLYTLGDNIGAAKAFEEAVLLAIGIQRGGISVLIDRILNVLKADITHGNLAEIERTQSQAPVLLSPEKATMTAKLVFPPDGSLPGLRDVPKGSAEKAAISTTSNSLLSLAKIFQDGMSTGGGAAGRYGATVKDILALYYLSLALHASPSTANNVGILLASIQQSTPNGTLSGTVTDVSRGGPVDAGIRLALDYYNYGLRLDNNHAHLYTNLGSLLKDINQLPMAIEMYERAVKCDGTFDIALANLANAVKDQGRISDAIEYYRRAVKANPEFAEAVCGLANALNSVCDWKGRGGVVRDGGNRDRWHVDDNGMLNDARSPNAVSYGWMKRVVEIVEKQLKQGESWGLGVLGTEGMLDRFLAEIMAAQGGQWSDSRKAFLKREVTSWIGQPYEGAKIIRLIERSSQRTVWRWYHDKYTRGLQYPQSEYRRPTVPSALTTPSAPTVLPFHTFTCPLSAKQVRLISERNGLRISCSTLRSSWLSPTVYPPPAPPRPYLKVGYISSDFNNHPLAHLMQSVFGLHNPSRVKAHCYATTSSDNSEHRKQIERESPVFYNAHSWSPDQLIRQIVNDGIHILINLNGFTRGARNEIFAARPAPIQMSFMGFAGTLGAEWCDYLYADTTAVPTEMLRPHRDNVTVEDAVQGFKQNDLDNWVYAENIIYARYSFFCCDHRQSAPDAGMRGFTWEQEKTRRWEMRKQLFPQLQDDQVILGNFNQLYKIEPTTFRTWLKILSACPKAVLWLLRFPDLGQRNLHHLATIWAGESVASRIIFTDVAPKPQHISRAQVCDLFLDTPECNAHTTAADVLWSGTPLLTFPRHQHKMCSRIAASILRAAVPQNEDGRRVADRLVVGSEEEYLTRAVELVKGLRYVGEGEGEGELLRARKMLWEERWRNEAFDTRRWVADLEDAYWAAWGKWERGEGGDLWLTDLEAGA